MGGGGGFESLSAAPDALVTEERRGETAPCKSYYLAAGADTAQKMTSPLRLRSFEGKATAAAAGTHMLTIG